MKNFFVTGIKWHILNISITTTIFSYTDFLLNFLLYIRKLYNIKYNLL